MIPAKLVRHILKPEFVDMAELLRDNMGAERRRWQTEGGPPQAGRVTSQIIYDELVTMLHQLRGSGYLATRKRRGLPGDDDRRCEGRGWLLYEAAFRQQITFFETANQSLYSTTFLAYGGGRAKFCTDCMMADHSKEECALHPYIEQCRWSTRRGGGQQS